MNDFCKNGHEFTAENTYWKGPQKRECRICRRAVRRGARYKKFGFTIEEVKELRLGACEICGTIQERMTVDHDHKTEKYRGVLCHNCNLILGHANDNIDTLSACITYLLKHTNVKRP